MEVSSVRYPRGHADSTIVRQYCCSGHKLLPRGCCHHRKASDKQLQKGQRERQREKEKESRLTNRHMIAVSFVIVRDNMMTGIDLFGGVFYFYYRPESQGGMLAYKAPDQKTRTMMFHDVINSNIAFQI